ncbi:MAG: hypothetical protein OXC48_05515 [Endozoicomonadaceae bacterium]|nr:hypothetical protein [Endozoicomonadaceae bacterium]
MQAETASHNDGLQVAQPVGMLRHLTHTFGCIYFLQALSLAVNTFVMQIFFTARAAKISVKAGKPDDIKPGDDSSGAK